MKHVFLKSSDCDVSKQAWDISKHTQGKKGIKEIRAFLQEAMEAGYIDGFEEDKKNKEKKSIYFFRVRAAFSDDRYSSRSLLSSTWYAQALTKEGKIESRKKLADYYFRLTLDKQSGDLNLEFTVQGFGRLIQDVGSKHNIELKIFDRRKTNAFFARVLEIIERLHPAMEDSRDKVMRRLEKETRPPGVTKLPGQSAPQGPMG